MKTYLAQGPIPSHQGRLGRSGAQNSWPERSLLLLESHPRARGGLTCQPCQPQHLTLLWNEIMNCPGFLSLHELPGLGAVTNLEFHPSCPDWKVNPGEDRHIQLRVIPKKAQGTKGSHSSSTGWKSEQSSWVRGKQGCGQS